MPSPRRAKSQATFMPGRYHFEVSAACSLKMRVKLISLHPFTGFKPLFTHSLKLLCSSWFLDSVQEFFKPEILISANLLRLVPAFLLVWPSWSAMKSKVNLALTRGERHVEADSAVSG